MSGDFITLCNCSNPYWLTDKEWVKIKLMKRQKENLMAIDLYFPKLTNKQKAQKVGISYNYYLSLRRKYELK